MATAPVFLMPDKCVNCFALCCFLQLLFSLFFNMWSQFLMKLIFLQFVVKTFINSLCKDSFFPILFGRVLFVWL